MSKIFLIDISVSNRMKMQKKINKDVLLFFYLENFFGKLCHGII